MYCKQEKLHLLGTYIAVLVLLPPPPTVAQPLIEVMQLENSQDDAE